MFVNSNKPGPVSLPYKKDGKNCTFTFVPGKNFCPDWELIKAQNQAKWHHYGQILTPFKTVDVTLPPDAEVGRKGGKLARDGEFESFDAGTCVSMVSNCSEKRILEAWHHAERTLGRDRKTVVDAIQKRINSLPESQKELARDLQYLGNVYADLQGEQGV